MKKIIIASLLIFICGSVCSAQDFLVYTVKGDITVYRGSKIEKIVSGMTLKSNDIINIPAESRLVILNESSKELHTIKAASNGQLSKLIVGEGNTKQQLTDSYLSFIKQKITGANSQQDKNYMQAAGTSYRDVDSTISNILVPTESIKQ